jgi:phosphatidylinositol glycan class S
MSAKVEATGEASTPLANMVDAANLSAEPPPEKAESILSRRLILLSFWAVAILFGLPIWWTTTTVYRAPLPLQQMLDWADGKASRIGAG